VSSSGLSTHEISGDEAETVAQLVANHRYAPVMARLDSMAVES